MISMDDPLLEPPTVWQDRVPLAVRERARRLVRDVDGEAWMFDGRRLNTFDLSATVGKTKGTSASAD
jgi:hypothetical protein